MLSNDRKNILLMHPVRVNWALTKWSKGDDKDDRQSGIMNEQFTDVDWFSQENVHVWDGVPFSARREFSSPTARRIAELYIRFRCLFNRMDSPLDTFIAMKNNFSDLEQSDDRYIRDVIDRLSRSGQRMAKINAQNMLRVVENENALVRAGMTKYIEESELIKFVLKCKRGLVLEEIDAFSRVIPTDVVDRIESAEHLAVFDNYYVMHYDPKRADNIHYTDEEQKDPIVFGVMLNSTKLYFVADWVDDLCDLTYDKLGSHTELQLQKITNQ